MASGNAGYRLDDQVGFLLRKANQRHTSLFAEHIPAGLTPTQFAALVRLSETGCASQNQLGRLTSMDIATIKGVADRLREKNLVATSPDPNDKRRSLLTLTAPGRRLLETALKAAREITDCTLKPLAEQERQQLLYLLKKIC